MIFLRKLGLGIDPRELLDLAQFEPASGNQLPLGVFDSIPAPSR